MRSPGKQEPTIGLNAATRLQRNGIKNLERDSPDPNTVRSPHLILAARLLLAAGRRDRQVLGLERRWAAGARRHLRPGRQCQRSLPTELHHCISWAGHGCPHSCSCSCRDGDKPPFGRPGAWEDGRSRQRWGETYVRCAGKATHFHIRSRETEIRPHTLGPKLRALCW